MNMKKDELLQTIKDQQIEVRKRLSQEIIISRQKISLFKEILESTPIKVVTGVRRSGKSTLVLKSLEKEEFLYFNFDDEYLGQLLSTDLSELIQLGLMVNPKAKYFVFDEIQNIEGWELFINKLHRNRKNIILTGSNSRLLSSELSTHLTGRHISIELYPFSFKEFIIYNNLLTESKTAEIKNFDHLSSDEKTFYKKKLLDYIRVGGFPEVSDENIQLQFQKMYLKELYEKIVSRDIVQRRKIKNIKALKEISLYLISNFSAQFTFQSIKTVSSVKSVNTVKNYAEFLQEAYVGFILDPFSFKVKERISLPKKFYIIDTVFADILLSAHSQNLGKKLENLIYIELKRRGCEIYYLKETSYEVDFLIREGLNVVELIQVCWSFDESKTKDREVSALVKASAIHKKAKLTILSFDTDEIIVINKKEVRIIPAWKWLYAESETKSL